MMQKLCLCHEAPNHYLSSNANPDLWNHWNHYYNQQIAHRFYWTPTYFPKWDIQFPTVSVYSFYMSFHVKLAISVNSLHSCQCLYSTQVKMHVSTFYHQSYWYCWRFLLYAISKPQWVKYNMNGFPYSYSGSKWKSSPDLRKILTHSGVMGGGALGWFIIISANGLSADRRRAII